MSKSTDRTVFDVAIETQLLVELLRKTEESITYAELSAACGKDVTAEGRGNLISARKIIQREDRVLWGVIRKTGLVRMDSSGILGAGKKSLSRIRNAAKNGIGKLECADYDSLTNEERIKFNATAAGLGAIGALSKTSSAAKIEKACQKSADKLNLGDTLKLFGAT